MGRPEAGRSQSTSESEQEAQYGEEDSGYISSSHWGLGECLPPSQSVLSYTYRQCVTKLETPRPCRQTLSCRVPVQPLSRSGQVQAAPKRRRGTSLCMPACLPPGALSGALGQGWHGDGDQRVCDGQRSHRVDHGLDGRDGDQGRRNIEPLHISADLQKLQHHTMQHLQRCVPASTALRECRCCSSGELVSICC